MPVFITYILSFVFVGIYWNNHHHLIHAADRITGGILWANLHLLFWLSLIPFSTGWMGRNNFAPLPTAVYGVVLLMAAIAYTILARTIIAAQGPHSRLKEALGSDAKGYASLAMYAAGDSARLHESVARLRAVCRRRPDLVHTRSADRALS